MDQKTYIAFDQYQRYQTICNVIEFYRQNDKNRIFKVLEIGSNEHKDLELFLPKDKIVFTDITLTKAMEQDPDFQRVDGTNLPYEDSSFDFVVAADVLEHVPQEKRMRFCHELRRVARIASVICFPYMTAENMDAEERLNVYYKSLYGSDFIWLKEHNTCGLPREEEVDRIYEELNSPHIKFHHGNLETWEKMWYCHFNTCGAAATEEYRYTIDHYYNTAVYYSDVIEPCYRVFYVSATEDVKALQTWMEAKWRKNGIKDDVLDLILSRHQHMVERCEITHEAAIKQAAVATLYWAEAGESFQEANTCRWEYLTSEYDLRFQCELPVSPASIRFDPTEAPCVVEDLHVYSNVGALGVIPENAIEYGGKYIFLDCDPRFKILMEGKHITSLDIRAHMTPLDYPEQGEVLAQLFQSREQTVQECRQLQEQLQGQQARHEAELAECRAAHEVAMAEIQTAHMAVTAEQEATHEAAMAEQKATHEAAMAEQKATYEAAMAEQQAAYEKELAALREFESKQLERQQELQTTLDHYRANHHEAVEQREELKRQLDQVQYAYDVITNAFFWKITKPVRVLVDYLKKTFHGSKTLRLLVKGIRCWKENGFQYTWRKLQNKLYQRQDYLSLAPELTQEQREEQKNYTFSYRPKFSIVVPLYNTPEKFLHEMMQSVLHQTYENWELCIADGSDDNRKITRDLCHKYMKKDKRIKYKQLTGNGGISKNTIEAYTLATGDYVVLMDHDDVLTEDALFECARCIEKNPNADFIYSDKGIFEDKTNRILAYHYLPDYSPEFLRATNYASHLNLFSRNILDKVGFIREGYDGSQDYDIELRVVEKARSIKHIAKVLYYCRACEGSVALNPESKMYAYEAGRRAIEEHIDRIGYPGQVEFLKETFSYRIHYSIVKPGKVSIIIPNKDHISELKTCIESILNTTNYQDYEIVVVENNSECADTFAYYHEIERLKKVKVLYYHAPTNEFNYSAINNYAVDNVDGKYVLFLNNDTKAINENWLTEMLMYAQRDDVGAVGAKLYYPDHTYQHIGLFIGLGGHIASHYAHRGSIENTGYMHRLAMPQNYNAVTAACLLMKREDFLAVHGFDTVTFKVGLNDVDLCLKLREIGKYNVLTPYAELYHYESISRKSDEIGPNKERLEREQKAFRIKWRAYYEKCDDYYNPNLHI